MRRGGKLRGKEENEGGGREEGGGKVRNHDNNLYYIYIYIYT